MQESSGSSVPHVLDPRNRKQSHPLKVQNLFLVDSPPGTHNSSLGHSQTTVPKGNSCGELVLQPELVDGL